MGVTSGGPRQPRCRCTEGSRMPVAASARNSHMAEQCTDESCPRMPCRVYKTGYRNGYDDGYRDGYEDGRTAGFAEGYPAGFSDGAASASSG